MGEWAELVLEGTLCEMCGEFVDDRGEGLPRKCCTCEVRSMTFFPPLPSKTFGLILADPPWRFKTYDGLNRKIERHYSLTALELLKMLDVESIADRHAVLVLWATQAQLDHALELMRVWGFRFKTAGAWAKQSRSGRAWQFGTGYLLRSAAEFFLIGTRGHPQSAVRNIRNLIVAPVREHSRKPDELAKNLERMYPRARKIELFAETKRNGWETWGKLTGRYSNDAIDAKNPRHRSH